MLVALPPPPLTVRLVDYLTLAYGPEMAEKLIAARGQATELSKLREAQGGLIA